MVEAKIRSSFIFSIQNKIKNLSITHTSPDNFQYLITNADWFLVFSQDYNGTYPLEELISRYKFLYLEFLELGYFWYGGVCDNILYQEGIFPILRNKLKIEIQKQCYFREEYELISRQITEIQDNINQILEQNNENSSNDTTENNRNDTKGDNNSKNGNDIAT